MTASIHQTALRATCRPESHSVVARIRHMFAVARQRRHLRALDDHLLEDIGISRAQALEESRNAAWNGPEHWSK